MIGNFAKRIGSGLLIAAVMSLSSCGPGPGTVPPPPGMLGTWTGIFNYSAYADEYLSVQINYQNGESFSGSWTSTRYAGRASGYLVPNANGTWRVSIRLDSSSTVLCCSTCPVLGDPRFYINGPLNGNTIPDDSATMLNGCIGPNANSSLTLTRGSALSNAADLRVAINSVTSDADNVTIRYSLTNFGFTTASAFSVDFWSDRGSAPVVGDAGETAVAVGSLGPGATYYLSTVVIPNSSAAGVAYAVVDTNNAISETDESNNVSAGVAWEAPLTAPLSYDFTDGAIPTDFVFSGDAPWRIDSPIGSNNGLVSGSIADNQTSCFAVTAFKSSSVTFSYMLQTNDYLLFYIDGVQQGSLTGYTLWKSGPTYTPALGAHEFKWCYEKDNISGGGLDRVWVDNISIN